MKRLGAPPSPVLSDLSAPSVLLLFLHPRHPGTDMTDLQDSLTSLEQRLHELRGFL